MIGEDAIREQIRDAVHRFQNRLSGGNLNLREFHLYLSYINYLLSDMKNIQSKQNVHVWQKNV